MAVSATTKFSAGSASRAQQVVVRGHRLAVGLEVQRDFIAGFGDETGARHAAVQPVHILGRRADALQVLALAQAERTASGASRREASSYSSGVTP
jgi:hypothetical protein